MEIIIDKLLNTLPLLFVPAFIFAYYEAFEMAKWKGRCWYVISGICLAEAALMGIKIWI